MNPQNQNQFQNQFQGNQNQFQGGNQNQYQGSYQGGRQGRRQGGIGGGCGRFQGRGRGQFQNNQRQNPHNPFVQANQQQTERDTSRYCWTHGACAHTSNICRKPAQGHRYNATFQNKQNGNSYNCHNE